MFIGLILAFISADLSSAQTRTVRIATYNIEADIDGVTTPLPGLIAPWTNANDIAAGGALEGIGEETVGGDPARPLDILALQETTSNPTTVSPICNALNTFYNSPGMYTNSAYQATEEGGDMADGNGPNAVVYNTQTLQLVASHPVDPPGGPANLGSAYGEYREVMRYEFAPAGVAATSSNIFYVYVSHYKSGTTSADATARAGEAAIIRTNESIDLPLTARVIYVGDYNVETSGETGYQTILALAAPTGFQKGQGVDPLNVTNNPNINWETDTSNTNILLMLTEHSYDLEYRDDLQLMTTNIYYGAPGGFEYVPGTYHAFGNNGTTAYYGNLANGTDTALSKDLVTNGPAFISAANLYNDLTNASDHLPVVADYTIPIPAPVFSGGGISGNNLTFNIADGITGAVYTVWMTTNLTVTPSNWAPVTTNICEAGNFTLTITNAFRSGSPAGFYLLRTQ
ncbi:MAG TPA: hypothetical protein VMF08_03250 [Candidatus Sulfotelmatobacter sp.]|nr:hypothetical protein [Candidatus Sulfotelmatobacter sp.]